MTDSLLAVSTATAWLSVSQTAPPQRGLGPDLEQGLLEAAWGVGVYVTDEELETDDD